MKSVELPEKFFSEIPTEITSLKHPNVVAPVGLFRVFAWSFLGATDLLLMMSNVRLTELDIELTINCDENPFLTHGMQPLPIKKAAKEAGRYEKYNRYESGVKLRRRAATIRGQTSEETWSFSAYKRCSRNKNYAGSNFYFSKELICFHRTLPTRGKSRCCVSKRAINGTAEVTTAANNPALKRVQKSELTVADGVYVY